MWKWPLAVLIVVAAEIYGFDLVASRVGAGNTFLLTIVTSVIGMVMMRFEGRKVLEDSRARINAGQVRGETSSTGYACLSGGFAGRSGVPYRHRGLYDGVPADPPAVPFPDPEMARAENERRKNHDLSPLNAAFGCMIKIILCV